jgi:hypothetical protein
MIKTIIQMLEIAEGQTENIRIAQGKNKYPNSISEVWKQFKKELRWQKK